MIVRLNIIPYQGCPSHVVLYFYFSFWTKHCMLSCAVYNVTIPKLALFEMAESACSPFCYVLHWEEGGGGVLPCTPTVDPSLYPFSRFSPCNARHLSQQDTWKIKLLMKTMFDLSTKQWFFTVLRTLQGILILQGFLRIYKMSRKT
jgi:hypothetical protein